MSRNLYRFIQSMTGLGLAVYLAEKLVSGKIAFYINLRFTVFTVLGIAGLMAMVISVLWPYFDGEPGPQASPVSKRKGFLAGMTLIPVLSAFFGLSAPTLATLYLFVFVFCLVRVLVVSRSNPDEDLSQAGFSAASLLILVIPLMLGFLVPVKPLTSSSLSTRGMGLSAPTSIGGQVYKTMEIAPDERSILDWVKLFNYESDLSSYVGVPADVTGFVYHDPRLDQGRFMVGRFIITCCVADAFAVGMVVDWPETLSLEENSWVNVKGAIDIVEVNNRKVPLIHADSVVPVQTPEQPYLYP